MSSEEHPREFLPELALGVLAEDEAPGIREHLAGCAECQAEYEVMRQTARLLPYAVEEAEPSGELKAGLMDRIAGEPRVLRPRAARPAWQRFAGMAAAAAVLLAVGGFAGSLLSGSDNSLEADNARQGAFVQAFALGTARRDTVEDGAMRASLVSVPGQSSAFAYLEGMPELPEGKAYQAWFIAEGPPQPANVFNSEGGVWLESPGDIARFGAMALTIEDKDGASAPSQQPFIVVQLRATAMPALDPGKWFSRN